MPSLGTKLDAVHPGRHRHESPFLFQPHVIEPDPFARAKGEPAAVGAEIAIADVFLAEPLSDSEKAARFLGGLASVLEARGISAVDLTPALRHAAEADFSERQYVFWSDDTHWNPRGIGVAAQAILANWPD